MTKENFSKTHTGKRREYRKNGDVYVFERVTAYDPKKKQTVTVKEKLLGKIIAGEHEISPTRPKHSKKTAAEILVQCQNTGTTDLLEWIGSASGIDRDVLSSFSTGDAEKILSIARYWVATNGNTLPRLETWQISHPLPYCGIISEDVYGDLFRSVGRNPGGVQSYFKRRAEKLEASPVIAYDSTTISTYSENHIEARQGFNKDHDGLNTVKLLTLYSVKDQEPIAFANQPGNIPDVISIDNTLKELAFLDFDHPMIVTDNGYYSERNLMEFTRKNMKFLTLVDPKVKWICEVIEHLRPEIDNLSNGCPFDPAIRGASTSIMHTFSFKRQRTRGGVSAGTEESFQKRLYVHVFYSPDNKAKKEIAFTAQLLELKRRLEEGETQFTEAAERKIKTYLQIEKRREHIQVGFNNGAIAEACKYFGFFALVGNQVLETFEALKDYRLRERIEELFGDQKDAFDGKKPRVWYPDSLKGREFVQFIGLGYLCFFAKKIKAVRQQLAVLKGLTQAEIAVNKKLAQWIDSHSIAQIFDWFDCIETTTIKTDAGACRWSTESVARDQKFLKMLKSI